MSTDKNKKNTNESYDPTKNRNTRTTTFNHKPRKSIDPTKNRNEKPPRNPKNK